MNEIGKNLDLLSKLTGENCLLDTKIETISIFEMNFCLIAEITLKMRKRSFFDKILLRLIGVKEYSFYYRSDRIFYNVERCKLLLSDEDFFYLCTDPFDDTNEISEHDQDYIFAKEIVAMELAEGSE